ncbi:2-hydroxyacid dehydrogenase [Marmoricola sp. RAF53]|uniref:2-hydroxyacid dehydrogenase n=1 Tax=Marmoricola sp. RAF53 TaxID=3233059 RepID=UPI003F970CD1
MSEVAWLPFDVRGLPDGVEYLVGDRAGPSPADLERISFYVMPYQIMRDDLGVLARMPRLRVVQLLTAGYEHLAHAVPAGVTLCNGRGIHSASTAELAMTLVLASLRDVPGFVRAQDEGRWTQGFRPSLADKRVLVLGYGSIGEALEQRLLPFEVDVVRVARTARAAENGRVHAFTDLPALLPAVDVVVVTAPLTEETRGLVDAGFLVRMRDGALLVNVARGAIVDTDALLAELTTGRLHAALDVVDPEPLPAGHPLWSAPNTLITPHVGGPSSAFRPRAERLVREQLERYARGEPLANVVRQP